MYYIKKFKLLTEIFRIERFIGVPTSNTMTIDLRKINDASFQIKGRRGSLGKFTFVTLNVE